MRFLQTLIVGLALTSLLACTKQKSPLLFDNLFNPLPDPEISPSPTPTPTALPQPSPTITPTGEQIFISQSVTGNNSGADCANAHDATWFNDGMNWDQGPDKISAGDTVHLCGTVTTTLVVQASGAAGAPIQIYFEPDAMLSQPAGTLLVAQDKSYLLIDGGTNGVLENTDNGSTRVFKQATSGIYAPGATDLEVRNLTIRNLYVHTDYSDSLVDFAVGGAVYLNGFGSNISIHHNTFQDICWIISGGGRAGASNISIHHNTFTNYDHAIAGLGAPDPGVSNIRIYDNHFGATANWDTAANSYHHDGIHVYFAQGELSSNIHIYNNLFDGDWGENNTAHVFLEGDWTRTNPDAVSDVIVYNNVFSFQPNRKMNNGAIGLWARNMAVYNNTIIGGKFPGGSDYCLDVGRTDKGLVFKNNLVTSCDMLHAGLTGKSTDLAIDRNLYADGGPYNAFVWIPAGGGLASYTYFSMWQSLLGADTHSRYEDKAGVGLTGYLLTGSPAVGAGQNLSDVAVTIPDLMTDKYGRLRPSTGPWDIGAYQFH